MLCACWKLVCLPAPADMLLDMTKATVLSKHVLHAVRAGVGLAQLGVAAGL
jgi:hypothetical protein